MHPFASRIAKEDRQLMERYMTKQANEYTMANVTYWMEHELRQYPRVELDLDALAAHARQLVLAEGRDAQDKLAYQPNKVLARQLGLDLVDALAFHRSECHCRSATSHAQRVCHYRTVHPPPALHHDWDERRHSRSGLVVARRFDATGARAWPGHDRRGPHGQRYPGTAYRAQ